MALPPGPGLPPSAQSVMWALRPWALLERAQRRYGDVFTLRLAIGGANVVVADPKAARDVYRADPDVFLGGRPNGFLSPLLGERSVLLLDGDEHARQRELMLPPFRGDHVQKLRDVVAGAAEEEVARWRPGQVLALRPRLEAIGLEVILRAVLGVAGERVAPLREAIRAVLVEATRNRLMTMLPALRRDLGPWRTWSRFLRARAELDGLLYEELAARRREGPRGPDALSLLLEARDGDGHAMSDGELRDELVTLLVAGHETTATALAWTFERLLRHPEAAERVRDDLAAGRSESLRAVVQETLRLRPVFSVTGRQLARPAEVAGHVLPAGTVVSPCMYLIHRRADLYTDPLAFRPERFLERGPDPAAWFPFGGGARRCLGGAFALMEMREVLRVVLTRVRLGVVRDEAERARRRAVTQAPVRGAEAVVVERLLNG